MRRPRAAGALRLSRTERHGKAEAVLEAVEPRGVEHASRRLAALSIGLSIAWLLPSGCDRGTIELSPRRPVLHDGGADSGATHEAGPAEAGLPRGTLLCPSKLDSECAAMDGVCLDGVCVQCKPETGCPALGGLIQLHCGPSHECRECSGKEDCLGGAVCDLESHRCTFPCFAVGASGCIGQCDLSRGLCVDCADDRDCAKASFLDSRFRLCVSGRCRQCVDDTGCLGDTPRCEPVEGRCVECLDSRDCTGGKRCDLSHKRCMQR